jgi:hypothetical protein
MFKQWGDPFDSDRLISPAPSGPPYWSIGRPDRPSWQSISMRRPTESKFARKA